MTQSEIGTNCSDWNICQNQFLPLQLFLTKHTHTYIALLMLNITFFSKMICLCHWMKGWFSSKDWANQDDKIFKHTLVSGGLHRFQWLRLESHFLKQVGWGTDFSDWNSNKATPDIHIVDSTSKRRKYMQKNYFRKPKIWELIMKGPQYWDQNMWKMLNNIMSVSCSFVYIQ